MQDDHAVKELLNAKVTCGMISSITRTAFLFMIFRLLMNAWCGKQF